MKKSACFPSERSLYPYFKRVHESPAGRVRLRSAAYFGGADPLIWREIFKAFYGCYPAATINDEDGNNDERWDQLLSPAPNSKTEVGGLSQYFRYLSKKGSVTKKISKSQ